MNGPLLLNAEQTKVWNAMSLKVIKFTADNIERCGYAVEVGPEFDESKLPEKFKNKAIEQMKKFKAEVAEVARQECLKLPIDVLAIFVANRLAVKTVNKLAETVVERSNQGMDLIDIIKTIKEQADIWCNDPKMANLVPMEPEKN